MLVTRFYSEMSGEWDAAVAASRNGTFLHMRGFMDYHRDRFDDYSLVARDGDRIVAVLPANRRGDTVYSHQGLTYGGWLMSERCDPVTVMRVVESSLDFMRADGVKELVYKPVPHIYHRQPAEDDLYALWRHGAQLSECNISFTIDTQHPIAMDRGNRSALNKARRAGIVVSESNDYAGYWQVLNEVLASRHSTRPVHSVAEMTLLQSRFPENIKLYTAMLQGEIVAGVVMFYAGQCAHCQYIASSAVGRENKALALVFHTLIEQAEREGYRYFDFGISTEDHGQVLNEGLATQKSRLGGRGIAYNVLTLKL